MIEASDQTFSFADFELNTARRVLLKNGETVALNAKAFDLLCVLLENHGRIVTKDELLEKVWEGQFVEENNLTVQISALRKVFGEKKGEHRFIVTIAGKGYKFVHELDENLPGEIIIETHKFERITIEENVENEHSDAIEIYETKQLKPPESTKNKTSNFSFRYIYLSVGLVFFIFFAVFAFWKTDSKAEIKPLKFTKLTLTGKIANATITPDGKYAVFAQTENEGESLWIKHLATGSQNRILKPLTVNFVGLTVSPDNNFIYASVFSNNFTDTQVWRIPLLGDATEQIQGVISGATVSLSPDGQHFAFIRSHGSQKENLLQIADLNGQNIRILARAKDEIRSFPNFRASPLAWSPDGAEIACVVQEKTNENVVRTRILLVNAETGAERFITEQRWGFVGDLVWLNNDELAFTASESNAGQIWKVSRKSGETNQITHDLNNYTWLAASNGNLLTVQKTVVSKINTADFDLNAKRIQLRQIFEESGYISNGAWTNDGRILFSALANGKDEIWRINADGGEKQQLTVNSAIAFGIAVSPIDGSILYSTSENSKNTLFLADSEGKNSRKLFEGTEDVWGNFTADGQSIIFQRGLSNKVLTLWRFDLADNKLTQLTQTLATHPAVSPDSAKTAYYFLDKTSGSWKIGLISTITGEFLGKIDLPQNAADRNMRWFPNGKFIAQIAYQGDETKLLLLPLNETESIQSFDLGKGNVQWFDWSDNGKKLVIAQEIQTQDVVLIGN